ncbi:biliverdin-producing heme oxygenase [Nocardioides marmoriginsengisoli]|uniref:Biliverdin-producing heme oxygenase n=1 Tax=Nocardioides marmoriginsengisoli TaxID=661483 RepID=A0A3N0CHU5_9ACTN|nr:biliverdin-producing heme oxygenase [Nocardioides marmoriginsengisoli]RNL62995.1 biliverdin-producing heme oxygenase [Nocardioides marmoriginsengisoli]
MTLLESTVDAPLSAAMREGSMAEHKQAEGSAFVERLLGGEVDERGYVQFLGRLRMIYAAMETAGRELQGDPIVAAVYDPLLERLDHLDADLDHWSAGHPPVISSPAADAYVARLEDSTAWGGLFLAHHYTRYLGDLSGGQAFGAVLRREFGLTGATGTAFYTFTEIPKPKPYKDAYRARLDALGLDSGQVTRVVDEVKVAFNLNQQLFAELSGNLDAWKRTPAS